MDRISVKKIAQLSGHSGPVYQLAQGPSPEIIYSASSDRFLASWNLKKLSSEHFSVKLEDPVYASLLLPSHQMLWVGNSKGGIHVIDLKKRAEVKHFTVHKGPIFDMKYAELLNRVYVSSADGSISVWEVPSLVLERQLPISAGKLRKVCLREDQKELAVACGEGIVRIFETEFLNEVYSLSGHTDSVYSVAYHPEKPILVTGGKDAYLRFWDGNANYKLIRSIPAHNFSIYELMFDSTGKWCATASRDKTVKIWDANSFEVLLRLDRKAHEGHRASVNTLLWSDFKNCLVTSGDDGKLNIWQISA